LNNITSAVVDLPFSNGYRFGSSASLCQQELLGGWQLTGINFVTSGVPINLTYTASSNQVVSTQFPHIRCAESYCSPTVVYGHTLTKTNSALNLLQTKRGNEAAPGVSIPSGTQLFGAAGRNNLMAQPSVRSCGTRNSAFLRSDMTLSSALTFQCLEFHKLHQPIVDRGFGKQNIGRT
jgi:hypothetical protein